MTDESDGGRTSSDAVGASEPGFADPTSGATPGFGAVRYERRQLVGVGGMGRVTVVYDRVLGREVALKEPAAGHDATLLEEARRAAALEHPGIVPVLDAGFDAAGRPWYTMRLLRGRPLEEALRGEADLPRRLGHVRALLSASEAVAYAHSRGVVHRDLTPANLLLGELGEVFVIDWGLAALQGARGGGGTRGYRSPEQEAGAPADARADVYALGAILFRLCAGVTPLPGASLPAITPPELAAVVARAMAPGPADRYPDARVFAEDLGAWLDGRRVSAHAYSRWELFRRFVATYRAPLTVALVALTVLIVTSSAQYVAIVRERDRALAAERAATLHLGLALSAQAVEAFRDGRLGDAAVLAAHAYMRSHAGEPGAARARANALGVLAGIDAGEAPEALEPVALPAGCDEVRLHEDGYVCIDSDVVKAWSWTGEGRGTWPGRWVDAAPSALGMVLLGVDGTVQVGAVRYTLPVGFRTQRLNVGGERLVAANGGGVATLALRDGAAYTGPVPCASGDRVLAAVAARDGRLAVACSSQDVYVGPADALVRAEARLPHAAVVDWLDGDLLVGTISGDVVRMRLDGVEVWRASIGDAAVIGLGPAGDSLIWARTPRSTTLLDARSGALRTVLPALRGAPAVGDDGVLHAVATAGHLRAWHLPAHWPGARVSTPSGLSTLAVSPDGAEVALGGRATTVARWRIADGSVRWEALVDGVVKGFAWGGDGLRATISGSNTTVLVTPDGPVADRLRPTAYRRLGVLPDGRLIAVPYGSGPIVWDDAAGREDALVDVPECHDLGVGADGAALLDVEGGVWSLVGGGARPQRLAVLPDARAVDAGPSGRVAVAAADRLVVLGPSGDVAFQAPLDGRTVLDVAWSLDGALLATGNLDGTADLWRAEDGALVATLAGHTDRVAALEFSPDGSWLVTASWDHSARRWSLKPVRSPPAPADVEARWGASLAEVEHDGRDEDGSDGPIEGAWPSP